MAKDDPTKNDPLGALWGPLERIRSGPGVVGRTSYVALALLVLSFGAVFALRDYPWMVFGVFAADLLIVVGYVAVAFWYANKYPQFATMEGTEVVRYTEIIQGAKEPAIIDGSATPVANTSPPQSIAFGGPRDE